MNSTDPITLLQETTAPLMGVDAEAIADHGFATQRRRRLRVAGAGLALALAAGAGGLGWQTRSHQTMVPGHTSIVPSPVGTTEFFRHESGVGANQVRTRPMGLSGTSTTPSTLYTVVEQDGQLRIQATVGGKSITLPVVSTFTQLPGPVGTSAKDRKQSVFVVPTPRDTTTASLVTTDSAANGLGTVSEGVILANGDHAAVFVTDRLIEPADVVGWKWTTADGRFHDSLGESTAGAGLAGGRAWVLPRLGKMGFTRDGQEVSGQLQPAAGAMGMDLGSTWTWVWVLPGDAHSVSVSGPGTHGLAPESVLLQPGSYRAVALTGRTGDRAPQLTWTDGAGNRHTVGS